ncbi:MAG: alpha/beta hydrolase fold domain-containing protein [Pseudomonadota bacterium]
MTDKAYMSTEAREVLAELAGSDSEEARRDNIDKLRQEARAAFLPRSERALARTGVRLDDITINGQPCLDIRPKGEVQGTVLYCYGGGYVTGSAQEDLIVSAALAAGSGARFVAVEYPLAPEHPWPAAHQAAWAVYDALSQDGPVALAGESAGGNLALTVMQRAGSGIPAVLLLSPWCDLTNGGDSVEANDLRDPSLQRAKLHAAAALYAGDADAGRSEISPLHGAFSAGGPPVMITTGTRDLLLSQCTELARRMVSAGQEVRLDVYDGLWHVFEFYDELPEAAASLAAGAAFLKGHLRG